MFVYSGQIVDEAERQRFVQEWVGQSSTLSCGRTRLWLTPEAQTSSTPYGDPELQARRPARLARRRVRCYFK
jgi:hypothetical protein